MFIALLNDRYLVVIKTSASQSDGVNTAKTNRVVGGNHAGRHIFVDLCPSLNHDIGADMRELVNETTPADDGAVVYLDLSCHLGGVGHDDIIVQYAVMGYMAVRHDEVVVTNHGLAFAGGTAVNGDTFAKAVVVAYLDGGVLTGELEVLRNSTNDSAREDVVTFTHANTGADDGVGIDDAVFVDDDVVFYNSKGTYLDGRVHLGVGMYE